MELNFFLQKTLNSDPDLEFSGPRKAIHSIVCYSSGISCSSFGSHPSIHLGLNRIAWNLKPNFTKSLLWILSPRTSIIITAWNVTGYPKGGQCAACRHLLINHSLVEMLLNAKPKATVMLTPSISCYWKIFNRIAIIFVQLCVTLHFSIS